MLLVVTHWWAFRRRISCTQTFLAARTHAVIYRDSIKEKHVRVPQAKVVARGLTKKMTGDLVARRLD